MRDGRLRQRAKDHYGSDEHERVAVEQLLHLLAEGIVYRQHAYVALVIRENLARPFVDVFAFKSCRKPVDRAHQQAERNTPRYSQGDFQVPGPYSPYNGIESEHVSEQVTDWQMTHQVDALTETNSGVVSQAPFTSKFERKVQDHRHKCESGEFGDRPPPVEIQLVVRKHCVKECGRSARRHAVEGSCQRVKRDAGSREAQRAQDKEGDYPVIDHSVNQRRYVERAGRIEIRGGRSVSQIEIRVPARVEDSGPQHLVELLHHRHKVWQVVRSNQPPDPMTVRRLVDT